MNKDDDNSNVVPLFARVEIEVKGPGRVHFAPVDSVLTNDAAWARTGPLTRAELDALAELVLAAVPATVDPRDHEEIVGALRSGEIRLVVMDDLPGGFGHVIGDTLYVARDVNDELQVQLHGGVVDLARYRTRKARRRS